MAILPLSLIVPGCLFEHRMHVVTRIEVIAVDVNSAITPSLTAPENVTATTPAATATGVAPSASAANAKSTAVDTSLPVMQFDEEIDTLRTAKLCTETDAVNNAALTQDTSDCSTFKLNEDSSLEFCGPIGLTSASKRGQGSYYYPNPPKWDTDQEMWDTAGSHRFYLTGSPQWWRVVERSEPPQVRFRGYPEFKETDTFWKLPCDQGIDEILLGILIVLLIRLVITGFAMFEEISKLQYVQANDSEPLRFGARLTMIKWTSRLEFTTTVILGFLLWFLYEYTMATQRCKYDAPEIYWTSIFFMAYAVVVVITLGLRMLREKMLMDADPGVCNKTCQQKFSANVMILPCGHTPGAKEPVGTPPQDSMRMCYACSHLHSECPVCKRLIESRRKIHRGYLSPFTLSACALVQMLIPVLNIKWVYMHSACFVRDIPPHEYAPGCIMLLLIIFALMGIGLLGMRVASVDGSSHFAARLYRTLTAMSFLFSLSSGVMFLGYAMPDFNAVSSTQEMLTVREWGYSQACVKEKMLNHAFKELFGNSCSEQNQALAAQGKAPWSYEMFSCQPCDKTSPNSCLGSVKSDAQGMYTSLAAFGFLVRAIADIYAYVCASAVVVFDRRQQREQNARRKSKKDDIKRKLTKLARRVLTRGYRFTAKPIKGKVVEVSPPDIWSLGSDKRDGLFKRLMLEVEELASNDVDESGMTVWDPSFFPPGVFQDKDSKKYKLLTAADREKYMEEVVNRVILTGVGVESNKVE